ncbi:MAG: hypothetical protein IIT61_08795 [Bacteroidales bacterium]|nr:hypothetical protein [Bacteroidales bacterium]
MAKVLVETSARHVHLTEEHIAILFGEGHTLTKKKDLSQPGQFACDERVTVVINEFMPIIAGKLIRCTVVCENEKNIKNKQCTKADQKNALCLNVMFDSFSFLSFENATNISPAKIIVFAASKSNVG